MDDIVNQVKVRSLNSRRIFEKGLNRHFSSVKTLDAGFDRKPHTDTDDAIVDLLKKINRR